MEVAGRQQKGLLLHEKRRRWYWWSWVRRICPVAASLLTFEWGSIEA
jgi:hypothetical protein